MSTQSNAVTGTPFEPQSAPAVFSATRPFYWAVRRELWENRSVYLAPFAVSALIIVATLIGSIRYPARMRAILLLDAVQQRQAIQQPYTLAALMLMLTTFVVAVFYCLDALHGERRDRSILFWKSLPVSDLHTVLAKASIPLVVLPVLTFAITAVTHLVMLLICSAVLLGSGLGVAILWNQVSFFSTSFLLLYHLLTVHSLLYAPIYGWLLLVSAWARRLAFLWALLPFVAIGVIEKAAFNTSYFAAMLANRIGGGAEGSDVAGGMPMDALMHITPGRFLASPGLWIGLAVFAVFVAAAVRLRRSQGPM